MRGGDDESETKPETVEKLIQMWRESLISLKGMAEAKVEEANRELLKQESNYNEVAKWPQRLEEKLNELAEYKRVLIGEGSISRPVDDELWGEYQVEVRGMVGIRESLTNSMN